MEHGEQFEDTAAREALEETGLSLSNMHHCATTNTARPEHGYHFVVAFVVGEAAAGEEPQNLEPLKCEGWEWVRWDDDAPQWKEPLFYSLETLRAQRFSPFDSHIGDGGNDDCHTLTESSLPNFKRLPHFNGAAAAPADAQLPSWASWMVESPDHQRVLMREWEDSSWRRRSGWQGEDLIHGRNSAVRVLAYYWCAKEQTLRGVVRFNTGAESHRGICHGGAMTSVLDDVLGHTCFMGGAGPWVCTWCRIY